MPLDKAGKYHMNPAMARMSEKPTDPAEDQEDMPQDQHPVYSHSEVHHHGDGSHTVIMHRHDGEDESSDHGSMDEACSHMSQQLGEKESGNEETSESDSGSDVDDSY